MSNVLSSVPSAMKIRDELEQMVLADLHGPVGGPEEEVDERSVRERYLVGMLAPRRQELSPEEFDELPQCDRAGQPFKQNSINGRPATPGMLLMIQS